MVHPDGHEWEQCAPRVMRNLDEIYAGVCDGMTYAEIEAQYPEEARGLVFVGDKLGLPFFSPRTC